VHLRTTNPIESTFATVRLRQRLTKDPGSRAAGVAMAFQAHRVRSTPLARRERPHLVAPVRAGAKFDNGISLAQAKLAVGFGLRGSPAIPLVTRAIRLHPRNDKR